MFRLVAGVLMARGALLGRDIDEYVAITVDEPSAPGTGLAATSFAGAAG